MTPRQANGRIAGGHSENSKQTSDPSKLTRSAAKFKRVTRRAVQAELQFLLASRGGR